MVNQCHECQEEWSVALMSVCVCVGGGVGSCHKEWSGVVCSCHDCHEGWSVIVVSVRRSGL